LFYSFLILSEIETNNGGKMPIVIDLSGKKLDLDSTAQLAAKDASLLVKIIAGIAPENHNASLRYNCFRVLMRVAANHPALLMPFWDQFADELHDSRADQQYIGIRLLAELIPLDTTLKFDRVFDLYFSLLTAPGLINANQVAGIAGKLALARPDLEDKITHLLLTFHNSHLDTIRNDLVKSYAIESFQMYFDKVNNSAPILEFIQGLVKSPSPRARKAAKDFLREHSK
jgi:hypothetical protein